MKKFFTLICIINSCIYNISANAQPVLEASSNPIEGTQLTIHSLPINTPLSQGPSGQNITWNFASLSNGDVQKAEFVKVNTTPYAAQFTDANVALKYESGLVLGTYIKGYEYFNADNAMLISNGVTNKTGGTYIHYNDAVSVFSYPFTYQSTLGDSFEATFISGNLSVLEQGTINTVADAYGALILPTDTIDNVLRVKSVKTYTQTIMPDNIVFDYIETIYSWYSPKLAYPLLTIIKTEVGGTNTTTVHFSETVGALAAPIINAPLNVNLQAKPIASNINISYNLPQNANVKLNIYNIMGQPVAELANETQNTNTYNYTLNTFNLAKGMYIIELVVDNQRVTKKIIIQ